MYEELDNLYAPVRPDCGFRLALERNDNDALEQAFRQASHWLFERGRPEVTPDDLLHREVRPLMEGINSVLQKGVAAGIEQHVPDTMRRMLEEDTFVFSGAKTYRELREMGGRLLDVGGTVKPYYKFEKEVLDVHNQYNRSYLEAEYIFATQSARMASRWSEFEQDGDRYDLQYRTADDERVRDEHRAMHGITLPPSDEFWNSYFPPNGWRCRCTAVQVRKGKYPQSDAGTAMPAGNNATTGKGEMFRFNPGKQKVIFPSHHPYVKEFTAAKGNTTVPVTVSTSQDVISVINDKQTGWFERGFKKLEITNKRGVNGFTDMNGSISLTKDRMNNTINGVNKLMNGYNDQITKDEADSLATFWHEINHNRNKKGNIRTTKRQTRYMELANEFVSRNTLPDFYGAFGSKVQHAELMTNRKSTGYNNMVNNYQQIIGKTGLDNNKVVESIKKHLFDEPYTDQKNGLEKALDGAKNNNGSKLKKNEIKKLVKMCDEYNENDFIKKLDELIR